ncbi:MAG: hypothetical protein M3141_01350 [Actinomycetota bacterium]|nr:hypothetical protein [Actinomycetota bacterium]
MPLALLANWVPDPTPEFGADPKPYVTLMLVGLAVGIVGHVVRSRPMVVAGIGLVFMGTFLLPLGVYLSKS